jgi:spore maturation protein CgeB
LDLNPNVEYEKRIVENLNRYGYQITIIDWAKELGIDYFTYPSADDIRRLYNVQNPRLIGLYDKINNLSKTHDVLMVCQSHICLPEFIESLKNKIYTVFYSADDPDASEVCSKPYVKCYDHLFAAGVNFDEDTKITEKFLEWGAKRANWWPLGFRGDTYNPNLKVEDIYQKKRDIDFVFVGAVGGKRKEEIMKLKHAFPKMKIFSRDFRTLRHRIPFNIYFAVKSRTWFWGEYLPRDQLASLYQRVKIGININDTYGPSTIRTYQLPANGVMQICDCPEGLNQVFKVGKEVVVYHSIDEAIDLIKYYLNNDEERKKIAAEGFMRAIKDYNRETTFLIALKDIEKA